MRSRPDRKGEISGDALGYLGVGGIIGFGVGSSLGLCLGLHDGAEAPVHAPEQQHYAATIEPITDKVPSTEALDQAHSFHVQLLSFFIGDEECTVETDVRDILLVD